MNNLINATILKNGILTNETVRNNHLCDNIEYLRNIQFPFSHNNIFKNM